MKFGLMRFVLCGLLGGLVVGLLIPVASSAQSKDPPSKQAVPIPMRDLGTTRQQIEADTTLAAEIKTEALNLYERAEEALARATEVESEAKALERRIAAAPTRIAAIRDELENPPVPAAPPKRADVGTLQILASQGRAELLAARDAAERQKATRTELVQASSSLVAKFVERERNLRKLDEEIAAPPSSSAPPVLRQARKDFLLARRALEQALLDAHRLRVLNHDLLLELSIREHDVALARVSSLEARQSAIEQMLQNEREIVAREGRLEAVALLDTTAGLPTAITTLAEENAALKTELEDIVAREKPLNESLGKAGQLLREVFENLSRIQERVATYGASQAIGRLLKRRLSRLPSTLEYRKRARERQREISEIIDRRIDIEDQRRLLFDVEAEVETLIASIPPELVETNRKSYQELVTKLFKSKYNTSTELHDAYSRYMTRLVALDSAEREIAKTVQGMRDFIRKELLWIPTMRALSPRDLSALPASLAWLLSPKNWLGTVKDAASSLVSNLLWTAGAFVLLTLILWTRHRARQRLPQLAEQVRTDRTESFLSTLKAIGYTLVAALTLPAVLAFFSRLLATEHTGGEAIFSHSVADALLELTIFAYVLSLLAWLTMPSGLGPGHFRWSTKLCGRLHRGILWVQSLALPLAFVSNFPQRSEQLELMVGLGRPALIAALLVIAIFIWRSFNRAGVFGEYLNERDDSWLARLWFLWFPVVLVIPLFLCVLSGLGYQAAARTLTFLIFGETMLLLIGLRLINDVLIRWFNVAERRSHLAASQRQGEEVTLGRGSEASEGSSSFAVEIPEVDYHGLGEQARSVIRMGVFLGLILGVGAIWGDLVPALGLLERIELPITKVLLVNGAQQQLPVTLADVFIGLLILAAALFVAKNLSGLLEFTFLRRLRLDPGGNYAIVTLCQYTIVAIGIIAILSTIGLQWSKVQWLIAALSVGLGFGLQEIVANFVSGIILLLERPVRIGDIVSVGNADGFISRIRIRATTILTWEKKELIIPNKEFITGQVLNWTLSDSVHRILLNVGIAYGSDVSKALGLMKEAASENENVLADPEPIVTFEAFGNDSLMLYLRSYIASPETRLATVTALHQAVYDKFKEAGIVIAFPQRDVHLDTSKPLEINLNRPTDAKEPR